MKAEKTRKYLRNYPYEVEEELSELERLAEIGRQVEFDEEQGKKYADSIYAKGSRVPNGCYINYGKDLDGCSTQQNEGCGRCILYKSK
jgi:hypothetical protein